MPMPPQIARDRSTTPAGPAPGRHLRGIALGAALALVAAPAWAQLELGVRGATLGIGVDVGYRVTRSLAVRGGANFFSLTRDETVEGIDYELTPKLRSFSGVVDLYPFGGVLHLTGGMVANQNTAEAEAVIGNQIALGNHTFTNTQVQSLRGTLEWERSTAPYAGIGLTSGGTVGIAFEAGIMFSGTPVVALSAVTTLTGPEKAEFDQAMADEENEIRSWIDDNRRWTKFYPVVALGVRVRF